MSAFWADFLAATLRVSTPIGLAALGILLLEQAGLFALGMEGVMLGSAFCSMMGATWTSSAWGGVIGGMAGGLAIGLIYGSLAIFARANQILVSVALNLTFLGLTSFLQRVVFDSSDAGFRVEALRAWALPVLQDLPILGSSLFTQPPLTYAWLLLAGVMVLALYHTAWGLVLRATGESPRSVDVVGGSVHRTQLLACALFGILGGLAGSALVLQQVRTFTDNITAGRGFIALVSVIFGRWDPIFSTGAALLFGGAEALQSRMQLWTLPISSYFVLMIPYLLALLALLGLGSQAQYPSSIGQPYDREAR